jgi:enoyl-CoA hydratase/carnithine racemase
LPETEFETIRYEVEDRIATITLNRPDKLNAYTWTMRDEIIRAFDLSDADDDVGAVIVTGEGRAFCAGADLTENRMNAGKQRRESVGPMTLRMFDSLKPIIGACNGPAIGVGVTMQLPMDIRLASENARYGLVFARRGITVEGAGSWFLPRIVGPSTAIEWMTSGRIFPAQEALDRGLVRSIHPPEELLPAARAIAREIVDNSAAVSVSLVRQMVYRMLGAAHPMEAHVYESRALYHRVGTPDTAEGVASFKEKRAAQFPMKVPTDLPDIWQDWSAPDWRE